MFWSELRKKREQAKQLEIDKSWIEGFKVGYEYALNFRDGYTDKLWEQLYGKYKRA